MGADFIGMYANLRQNVDTLMYSSPLSIRQAIRYYFDVGIHKLDDEKILTQLKQEFSPNNPRLVQIRQWTELERDIKDLEDRLPEMQEDYDAFRRELSASLIKESKKHIEQFDPSVMAEIKELYEVVLKYTETSMSGKEFHEKSKEFAKKYNWTNKKHRIVKKYGYSFGLMSRLTRSNVVNLLKSTIGVIEKQRQIGEIQHSRLSSLLRNFKEDSKITVDQMRDALKKAEKLSTAREYVDLFDSILQEGQGFYSKLYKIINQIEAFKSIGGNLSTYVQQLMDYSVNVLDKKTVARFNKKITEVDMNGFLEQVSKEEEAEKEKRQSLQLWLENFENIIEFVKKKMGSIKEARSKIQKETVLSDLESTERNMTLARQGMKNAKRTYDLFDRQLACAKLIGEGVKDFDGNEINDALIGKVAKVRDDLSKFKKNIVFNESWRLIDHVKSRAMKLESEVLYVTTQLEDMINKLNVPQTSGNDVTKLMSQFNLTQGDNWQNRLCHLLMSAGLKQLDYLYYLIYLITNIDNELVKSLLIRQFYKIHTKLSVSIIKRMKQWLTTDVSRDTIQQMLHYLGIKTDKQMLNKILAQCNKPAENTALGASHRSFIEEM